MLYAVVVVVVAEILVVVGYGYPCILEAAGIAGHSRSQARKIKYIKFRVKYAIRIYNKLVNIHHFIL